MFSKGEKPEMATNRKEYEQLTGCRKSAVQAMFGEEGEIK